MKKECQEGAGCWINKWELGRSPVEWKNEKVSKDIKNYSNYLKLPSGMISGYYKFIVFDEISNSTGKVYDIGCHKIFKENVQLENTDWVNKNHWCVPIYYKGK